jgi:hypothetical protein
MDEKLFQNIEKKLAEKDIYPAEARKTVCLPLSSKIPFGYIPPNAWSKFDLCRRQLSWYYASKYAGKYLLICEKPLSEFGIDLLPDTTIEKAKFKPKRLPDQESIRSLAEKEKFKHYCPPEFLDIGAMDEKMKDRWMKIMGVRGITYDEVFVEQCANHANFIEPEYFLETNNGIVPYSIGKTSRICSACLEFFNIIGDQYKDMYVVPCPGAVLFAGMSVNKYYLVSSS